MQTNQPQTSIPAQPCQHSTAQLPACASCIAGCTCNSHCIQPLARKCLYLRPGLPTRAWATDSAAADLALLNAMPCYARHAPHWHPHFIGMGGPQRDTATFISIWFFKSGTRETTRPIVRDPLPLLAVKPPAGQRPGRPNNVESRKRASMLLRWIRSLPLSYNTCRTELIRMLPRQRAAV